MRKIKYSIRKGSKQHFSHVSAEDQPKMIAQALNYIAEVCDARFTLVEDERKANVRFSFWNSKDMIRLSRVNREYRALSDPGRRWIALNNQQPIGWTQAAVFMITHEMGHIILGPKHTDEKSLMHPYGSYYMSPKEAIQFQRRCGKPKKIFYPWDKGVVGLKLRQLKREYNALMKERERLIALRDGSTDVPFRKATQAKVLANLDKIRALQVKRKPLHTEWWRLKKLWNTVPFAG